VVRQQVTKAYGGREGEIETFELKGACVQMSSKFQSPKMNLHMFVRLFNYFKKFYPLPGLVIYHIHRFVYYQIAV
jgi:hypothetical protein